ncbi:hypothetical protein ACFLZX_00450 [Nanoarchaeota archaeon]
MFYRDLIYVPVIVILVVALVFSVNSLNERDEKMKWMSIKISQEKGMYEKTISDMMIEGGIDYYIPSGPVHLSDTAFFRVFIYNRGAEKNFTIELSPDLSYESKRNEFPYDQVEILDSNPLVIRENKTQTLISPMFNVTGVDYGTDGQYDVRILSDGEEYGSGKIKVWILPTK